MAGDFRGATLLLTIPAACRRSPGPLGKPSCWLLLRRHHERPEAVQRRKRPKLIGTDS